MPTHQFDFLTTAHHYKILAICTLIALIAFFDFMAFWYSSNVISSLFFSENLDSAHLSLYMILLFGSSYLVRPFGAVFFGRFGDKYGRKPALLFSMIGITCFTFMMALLPTYQTAGVFATFLFIFSRIGQGITFGTQLPTLWVYITEQLPINTVGMACGTISAGAIGSGIALIGLLNFLDSTLTQDELVQYGWRLPFLIGSILGLVAVRFCYSLNETSIFLNKRPNTQPTPAFKQRWQGFMPVLILSWFISSIVMVLVFFLIDLVNLTFFVDENLLGIAFMLALIFLVVGCVFFGFLTDRFNGGKVLVIGCILLLMATFEVFYDLEQGGDLILFSFSLMGLCAGVIGAVPIMMVRLCPAQYRLSTLAIGYNIAYAISGAFIPILLGFFTYHANFAPAVYLSFVSIITMFLGFYIYYSPRNKEAIEN